MPKVSRITALSVIDLEAAKREILSAVQAAGTVQGAAPILAIDHATLKRLIVRIEQSAPGFRAEIARVRR